MKVWAVYVNTDLTEGRGPVVLKHLFLEEEYARDWVESQPDPWNRPNRKWENGNFGHMSMYEMEVIEENIAEVVKARATLVQSVINGLGREEVAALEQFGLQIPPDGWTGSG